MVKVITALGAREGHVNTGVLLLGWLLTTTMLVKVTLPLLLTLPEKENGWPGGTDCRHDLVTLMPVVRVF